MSKAVYNNPPLIEANCEMRFEPKEDWDDTFIGQFFEKIKDSYPLRKSQHEVTFQFEDKESAIRQYFTMKNQFYSEDKSSFVQVGKNILVINKLKPYESWDAFKLMIDDAFNNFNDIVNPRGVMRINLRYKNRITFKQGEKVSNYLNIYPYFGEEFQRQQKTYTHFDIKIGIPYEKKIGQIF